MPLPLSQPKATFAGIPSYTSLDSLKADAAILSINYRSPYPSLPGEDAGGQAPLDASAAIRNQSLAYADHFEHHDFDFGGPLLPPGFRVADCGNLAFDPAEFTQSSALITRAVREIITQGAIPIILGTDEGGTIPVMRAFANDEDICVVHLDAHIDWRDERDGVREGYSNVMRRASEMPAIKSMAQVGLRGIGSARQEEIDQARSFGSVFITARQVHELGVGACLEMIPRATKYYLTIDSDVFDLAMMPAVLYPTPDGLKYNQTCDLVRGLAARAPLAGIGMFEVRPQRDIHNLGALNAAHLIMHFLGILARQA